MMAARLMQVVIGVWLVAAPAVLGYGDPAATNDRIFGPIAASLAFVALWAVVSGVARAILPVAVWLVIAPVALSYDQAAATLNSVLAGLVLGALVLRRAERPDRFWGGWRSLIGPLPGTQASSVAGPGKDRP